MKKGRIIAFDQVDGVNAMRKGMSKLGPAFGGMFAELNYYYDISKCGIGYHGDTERSKVVGVRVGSKMNICYHWFYHSAPIGRKMTFILREGDLYIMSEKTTGNDWKLRNTPTLRHAAGSSKYTDLDG